MRSRAPAGTPRSALARSLRTSPVPPKAGCSAARRRLGRRRLQPGLYGMRFTLKWSRPRSSRERARLLRRVVDAGEHHVLDEDAAPRRLSRGGALRDDLGEWVAVVHRHDPRPQLVVRRVEREREADRLRHLVDEALQAREPADRRDRRAAVRDPEVGQPPRRAEHLVEVEHRLAHPHEDGVVDLGRAPEVERLVEDLRRGEVPAERHRARRAERARERAAGLRREAERAAAVAVAHEHRLDRVAVGGAEERLDRAVLRLALGLDRERGEGHRGRELVAQRARQVRHRVVAGRAARRPLPDLARAERGLAALRAASFEEGQVHRATVASVVIDLRSDTVTKPTPGMLAAMAAAEVGDEQEREDPTTNELQRRMAELLGHEAALFLPTATMANQVALRALSRPGRKVVAEERTHVLIYEWGGPAIHSGLVMHGLVADGGTADAGADRGASTTSGPAACSFSRTRTRSSGGRVWPLDEFRAVVDAARERGAAVHLDGARLFNASVAAGRAGSAWSALADTVTICFSKGLGCPFGAVLAGSAELIERAWEGKFLFGGALRQSGHRLGGDALRARPSRRAARRRPRPRQASRRGHRPRSGDVETNFVQIPDEPGLSGAARRARRRVGDLRPGWLRAVTHLDIGDDDIDAAIRAMQEVLACPRLSSPLAASSTSSTGSEQRDKRYASLAAAVLRDGELDLGEGRRRRRRRGGVRGDARHAVPHRLDHEDVHGRGDHAAPRRGQARPRGHARPARRGRRVHDRRSAGCSRMRPACSARRTTTRG